MQVCPSCGEENPERFRLCGYCGTPLAPAVAPTEERRTVTIVFSDLQGSTKLGETLDPEAVREVMSRYFDVMTAVLRRHGATIEKFIGDAIMAVFGLPRVHEDDALRAVRAAHETQAALAGLNDELERAYGIRLTNRTGVNTGEVVTGDAATAQRLVTGDTVNTTARLEQAAGPNEILIGDLTLRLVRDAVTVSPVEPLELKGKAERVPAYRLDQVHANVDGLARRQDSPLVGRVVELNRLRALFDEAIEQQVPRMATIIGEAGVGKTRLTRELVGSLGEPTVVVRGRCLPYGDGITFWPVAEAILDAASIATDDPGEVGLAKLQALTDDREVTLRLGSILGFTQEHFAIDELFWGIRRWLELMAEARGPVVWVIDDIHWAEATLLDLIGHLLETVEQHALLLLCSSRHDLLDRYPDWANSPGSERIVLEPLNDADAAEVITNVLGTAGIPRVARDRVVQAAEGNPLFVEQLVSMLVDSGQLRRSGDGWEAAVDLRDLAVPPTIQALVAARLDLLASDERAVIEPASVAGLEFAVDAVRALVPDGLVDRVSSHLLEIERKQLIRSARSTSFDEDGYRFHHGMIRDAAYQNLLKRARSKLHEQFVTWADRVNAERDRGGEYDEILAYHLEQAHRYLGELGPLDAHGRALGLQASGRLGVAGRRAMNRGDMPAAANLLRRAAAVIDESPDKLELLIDLGEALSEMGSFAEAEGVLTEAHEAAQRMSDERLLAKTRVARLAAQLYTAAEGWTSHADEAFAAALPTFEAAEDHDGLALAWRLRFGRHGMAMRFGEAAEAAERVVAHARVARNRRYETRGASGYAQSVLLGPTPVPEAIERCRQLLAEVETDRHASAFIRTALAQLEAMDNRIDEARTLYDEAVTQLRELGSAVLAASSSIDSAQIEFLAGDLVAAERLLRADHDALTAMGERSLLPSVDGRLARVLYALERFEEAEAIARSAQSMSMDDDLDAQAMWRSVLAMIVARKGETDAAVRMARDAVELRRRSDAIIYLADTLTDLGEVLRFTGREDEVLAVRTEALRLYEQKGDVVSAGRVRALLAES
ncbi:MAG: AAA family ATPase [Chloroflexi bacterium]|nr:AAA family ATPase [Chloroflexota bacterium]